MLGLIPYDLFWRAYGIRKGLRFFITDVFVVLGKLQQHTCGCGLGDLGDRVDRAQRLAIRALQF